MNIFHLGSNLNGCNSVHFIFIFLKTLFYFVCFRVMEQSNHFGESEDDVFSYSDNSV